jgi:hypothetical protein
MENFLKDNLFKVRKFTKVDGESVTGLILPEYGFKPYGKVKSTDSFWLMTTTGEAYKLRVSELGLVEIKPTHVMNNDVRNCFVLVEKVALDFENTPFSTESDYCKAHTAMQERVTRMVATLKHVTK